MPNTCTNLLDRLPDSAILARAQSEQRILLTHDLDFGELMAASGANRLRNMSPDRVNAYIQRIIALHPEALAQGAVVNVAEGQIRVRLLPLETGR